MIEPKQIQQKSEVLMQRHQALMKSTLEGIHIMDTLGNIVEVNDTFCHMLGYTQNEMSQMNVADWDVLWSREELQERFKKLVLLNGALFETRHRRKDGTLLDVEVSTTGAEIDGQRYLFASCRDITGRKRIAEALREQEEFFRLIAENVDDFIAVLDLEGRRLYNSPSYARFFGETESIKGTDSFTEIHPDDRERIKQVFNETIQSGIGQRAEFRFVLPDGSIHYMESQSGLIKNSKGKVLRVVVVSRDITERKQVEEELRIAAIAFETQEGIMVTDTRDVILRVNHAFTEITGYTEEETVGQTPRILHSGHHDAGFYGAMWDSLLRTGEWQGEIWNRRKNGEVYPDYHTITAVKGGSGEITHYVATMSDVTERKRVEEQIHNLAFHDALTQLPNRRLLKDRLEQTIAVSKRSGIYGALIFLDMDNFKPLNDTYGHDVGDLLLIEVARRINSSVRVVDTVSRFGGDEFVVMLSELNADRAEAAAHAGVIAEKILAILAKPYLLKFQQEGKAESTVEHYCTSSIGVAVFDSTSGAQDVIKWADRAMYQAKEAGGNLIRFFDLTLD
jgi:diguanylate cyclase (GGDEF)-like protein/PAS domain S-box-containing protein